MSEEISNTMKMSYKELEQDINAIISQLEQSTKEKNEIRDTIKLLNDTLANWDTLVNESENIEVNAEEYAVEIIKTLSSDADTITRLVRIIGREELITPLKTRIKQIENTVNDLIKRK